MGTFHFKKFAVVNERSAMKVNTDGVLLGAAVSLREGDRNVLDVGTGTGTIALMVAQRLSENTENFRVDAIDIDEASAAEAAENFADSAWAEKLYAHHKSLEEFSEGHLPKYDLILSNPPYFEDSLLNPAERKCNARHTVGLSYRELLDFSAEQLSEDGRFAVILPAEQELQLCRYARMKGLHLLRIMRVRTTPKKPVRRIVAEFARTRCPEAEDFILTIQDGGAYTSEYLSLTHDFYLFA